MSMAVEELVAVLVSPEEYAYHVNQVTSVGTESLRRVRKQMSIKTPYVIEHIPLAHCAQFNYRPGLAPFRIVLGTLVVGLMLGIFYYLGVYWSRLEPGTTIRVGLLGLALIWGLKWAFHSKTHRFDFVLRDGSKVKWRSRAGDFKYKERAVSNVLRHLSERGLWAPVK